MTITAKVIADSIGPAGIRLTTLQLRYPKFIHGEFMTHRVFSRNASSSRAIPVERLIQDVIDDPAMPVYWGSNRPGMQAGEEVKELYWVKEEWLNARDGAVQCARELSSLGLHKQIVNRIIEPWCHINVVVTATEWANFFALRRHKDAQPEMKALADTMFDAQQASTPIRLKIGEWHLPYVTETDVEPLADSFEPDDWKTLVKLSVARCARVSYLTHEGKSPNPEEDLKLYERLIGSTPLHASPAEHQATPDQRNNFGNELGPWYHQNLWGNFVGWCQYRKTLPDESVKDR